MDNKSKVKKETGAPTRKGGLKFAPKVPVKKAAKIIPKKEPVEDSKDETINKELMMKLKASQITDPFSRRVKTEEKPKSQTQVAFGQGNSSYARSFAKPKKSSEEEKLAKEYAEPWDYSHTDYPVTLPLRRPYSGDPGMDVVFLVEIARDFLQLALTPPSYIPNEEILDEEEFGESSANKAQDAKLTAAEELGLMDWSGESQLLFVQLPASLPLPLQPQSVAEPNKGSEERREATRPSHHGSKLKDLPGGYMGKILVYRSGKVKMKIGDTLFDVSSGSNCKFVQEVAAVNTREKHCCTVGEISKRAVITPDIGYLLGSVDKMEE